MNDQLPAALIMPTPGGDPAATLAALARQSAGPPGILLVGEPPPTAASASLSPTVYRTVGQALRAAADRTTWVWLLDCGSVPEPSALEALLRARARMPAAPAPGLLASQVLTADGALDRASIPALEGGRTEHVLPALEQRAVALRAARYGSLLVHAPSAIRAGAANRRGAAEQDLLWTARLMRDRAGMLVPDSAVIRGSGRRPLRSLSGPSGALAGMRLLVELPARERLWFLTRLVGGAPDG